jgi:hypothetical protein
MANSIDKNDWVDTILIEAEKRCLTGSIRINMFKGKVGNVVVEQSFINDTDAMFNKA